MAVLTASLLTGGSWMTVVLSLCLLTILLLLAVQRGKFLYALRNVPYPTALPVVGNAYQLNCSPEGKIPRRLRSPSRPIDRAVAEPDESIARRPESRDQGRRC